MAQAKGDDARYKELEKFPGAASKQDVAKYAAQLAVAEADAKYAHESQRLAEIGPRRRTSTRPAHCWPRRWRLSSRSSAGWPTAT